MVGQGTSSSSSAEGISGIASLDALLKAIEEVSKDTESGPARVADIARRHKELLEKRQADLEAFLLQCEPATATPVMVAALKILFDSFAHKNYEVGMNRVVELVDHYFSNRRLVSEQLRLIPEFVFPLLRAVGEYCLERKDIQLGFDILSCAFSQIFRPTDRIVSSAHMIFLAICLKLRQFEAALPYIYHDVRSIAKEYPVPEQLSGKGPKPATGSAYFAPMFMLQYLYYGGMILLKMKDYTKAVSMFESAVLVSGNTASLLQIDAMKKLVLASLISSGSVPAVPGKSPAFVRAWKSRGEVYNKLQQAATGEGNKVAKVKELIDAKLDTFLKDQNYGLAMLLIKSLKVRSLLAVAKCYSTIKLEDVVRRTHCANVTEALEMIEKLHANNELFAEVDLNENIVRFQTSSCSSSTVIDTDKLKRLEEINIEVQELDVQVQMQPTLLAKTLKNAPFMEDEGLSMQQNTHASNVS